MLWTTDTPLIPKANGLAGSSPDSKVTMEIAALTLDFNRGFRNSESKSVSLQAQKRFIKVSGSYARAVISCCRLVTCGASKRDTDDIRPAFALIELNMNLPDKVV